MECCNGPASEKDSEGKPTQIKENNCMHSERSSWKGGGGEGGSERPKKHHDLFVNNSKQNKNVLRSGNAHCTRIRALPA